MTRLVDQLMEMKVSKVIPPSHLRTIDLEAITLLSPLFFSGDRGFQIPRPKATSSH